MSDKPKSASKTEEEKPETATEETGTKAPDPTQEGPGLHPIKLDPATGVPLPQEEPNANDKSKK